MEIKKGIFVNYQMAEAINVLVDKDGKLKDRKLAEEILQQLKSRWTTQDKIPGYGITIGDKIAGMEDITLDEILKFATDIKQADTYSTECIGNMQYCLIRNEDGSIDFDFSYLRQIADLAKANEKKLVIDSAVVFGDRFPENMANMSTEEIESTISLYTQKLTREFGDRIDRIDVLNSVFKRNDVPNRDGNSNSEKFWIDAFGEDYASKVLDIVRQNCQKTDIKLCWNEFYITNQNNPEKQQAFIEVIKNTSKNLDVIGLQDNFRADTSSEYIQTSLERIAGICKKLGKKLSITELSCKVGRRDIEILNKANKDGDYSSKVSELNSRIKKVLQTVNDFSEENKDVVSSVESRYSDRYDCNYRECKEHGHSIQTSPKRDNSFEKSDVLKSGVEATEQFTRACKIEEQSQNITPELTEKQILKR